MPSGRSERTAAHWWSRGRVLLTRYPAHVAFSFGTRLTRAGNHLTQAVGLGIAVLTLATMPGGWPSSGLWAYLAWAVAACMAVYLLFSLWELLGPPSEETIVFRYPRRSGTIHDIRWLDDAHKLIHMDRKSRSSRTNARIADYMCRLLSDASSARILTRDLSWSDSADVELGALARSGDLTIIGCSAVSRDEIKPNISRYKEAGARVYTTRLDSSIRMTSVDKAGARIVAIGHGAGRTHIIRQTADSHDPVFRLADTLFNALEQGAR